MIKIQEEKQFTGHFSYRQPDRVLRMCEFLTKDLTEGNLIDIIVMETFDRKCIIKYKDTIKFEVTATDDTDMDNLIEILGSDGYTGFATDNLLERKGDNIEGIIRIFDSSYRFTVKPVYEDSDFRMGNIY